MLGFGVRWQLAVWDSRVLLPWPFLALLTADFKRRGFALAFAALTCFGDSRNPDTALCSARGDQFNSSQRGIEELSIQRAGSLSALTCLSLERGWAHTVDTAVLVKLSCLCCKTHAVDTAQKLATIACHCLVHSCTAAICLTSPGGTPLRSVHDDFHSTIASSGHIRTCAHTQTISHLRKQQLRCSDVHCRRWHGTLASNAGLAVGSRPVRRAHRPVAREAAQRQSLS